MPDWALRASCELSMWTDLSPRLHPVICPALVMIGRHDPVYGPEYQETAVLLFLPHGQRMLLDCGHGFHLEIPDQVAHHLSTFLAERG